MKPFGAVLVGILFLLAGPTGHGQNKADPAFDLIGLQGVWMMASVDPGSSQVDRAKFVFKGDQFFRLMEKEHTSPDVLIVRNPDEFKFCRITLTGKFALAAGEAETVILFSYQNKVAVRGLLKFDDRGQTQLRLCLAPASANAPTSFDVNEQNRQVVLVLSRIQKFEQQP